jgi:hypothetical protein
MAIQTEGRRLALRASRRPQLDRWLVGLRKVRFAGETKIAGARENAALMLRGERSIKVSCAVCGCPHNMYNLLLLYSLNSSVQRN